jgi:hypothetical protein
MYNIVFTAIPVMWFALFDSQFPKEDLLSEPKHYKIGLLSKFYKILTILDESFHRTRFWRWIL